MSVIHAFFQRLSNAIRSIMSQKGCTMIDYIDDYGGVATLPSKLGFLMDTSTLQ